MASSPASRQWEWRFLSADCPCNPPPAKLANSNWNLALASTPSCLELASLTGNSPCVAKSPMGLASPVRHNKLTNGTNDLLCACMHLRRKQIHAGNTFKTTPFWEIVCKNTPKGAICLKTTSPLDKATTSGKDPQCHPTTNLANLEHVKKDR